MVERHSVEGMIAGPSGIEDPSFRGGGGRLPTRTGAGRRGSGRGRGRGRRTIRGVASMAAARPPAPASGFRSRYGSGSPWRELWRHVPTSKRVVPPRATKVIRSCFKAAAAQVWGSQGPLRGWGGGWVAGKSGTSDGYRDAWYAGWSGRATCVVRCGHDGGGPLAGTGGMLAAPLWQNIMRVVGTSL